MSQMQPAEALANCEQALRTLIAAVMTDKVGRDWLSRAFTEEKLAKIRETREEETRRRTRRGVASMPRSELAYVQFFDLIKLVDKHWEHFKPALGPEKGDMLGLLRRFEALRNTVAHSRDVLPFEEDLLSGIAGEIRNRVTIFMSSQDPLGEVFARIDSVTDSLGNVIDTFPQDPAETGAHLRTGAVLHPGDTVTFRCRGTDPQGRQLEWWMITARASSSRQQGRDVTITWHVTDGDVAAWNNVGIYMRSVGEYHRVNAGDGFDYAATFAYTVLPSGA